MTKREILGRVERALDMISGLEAGSAWACLDDLRRGVAEDVRNEGWDEAANGMSIPTDVPQPTPEQREALARLLGSVVEHEPTPGARIVRNPHQADVLIDALVARVIKLERRVGPDPRPIDLAYGDALKARLAEVEAERDELRSELGASLLARGNSDRECSWTVNGIAVNPDGEVKTGSDRDAPVLGTLRGMARERKELHKMQAALQGEIDSLKVELASITAVRKEWEWDARQARTVFDGICRTLIHRENSEDWRVSFGRMTDARFSSENKARAALAGEALRATSRPDWARINGTP